MLPFCRLQWGFVQNYLLFWIELKVWIKEICVGVTWIERNKRKINQIQKVWPKKVAGKSEIQSGNVQSIGTGHWTNGGQWFMIRHPQLYITNDANNSIEQQDNVRTNCDDAPNFVLIDSEWSHELNRIMSFEHIKCVYLLIRMPKCFISWLLALRCKNSYLCIEQDIFKLSACLWSRVKLVSFQMPCNYLISDCIMTRYKRKLPIWWAYGKVKSNYVFIISPVKMSCTMKKTNN